MAQINNQFKPADYVAGANGMIFNAANQASQLVTQGFATTYSGLCLSNPLTSAVNLAVMKVGLAVNANPAAAAVLGIMAAYAGPTGVTVGAAITPVPSKLGGSTGYGVVGATATFPIAPSLIMPLQYVPTTAAEISPSLIDIGGSVVLPPGAFAAICTIGGVTGTTGIFSWQWEEIPA